MTSQLSAQDSLAKQIEHGRYLVEQVAFCVGCHTPRDAEGKTDRSRLLQGAPLEAPPGANDPNRPKEAPAIAGLPKDWSETDTIKFLQTGVEPDGEKARPPMRPYRFTAEDAADVAAYLKSLKPATH